MLSPGLRHVLQLAKRTGDRVIVVDGQTDEAFVLMSVQAYEDVLGVEVDNGADMPQVVKSPETQANAEIAQWREQQQTERVLDEENFAENSEKNTIEANDEEDRFYIEPVA